MHPSELHVVTARVNPLGWKVPEAIYREFSRHMIESGVNLTVVECQHGEKPFLHDDNPNVTHIGVRAKTVLWTKENLLNIGIRAPQNRHAKYFAWIDADIFFRQDNWAEKTLQGLQLFPVLQNWATCSDLGPNGEHCQLHHSFGYQYYNGFNVTPGTKWAWSGTGGPRFPHPGFSWCATREALESTGGLLEMAALGSGDAHMALAYVGMAAGTYSQKVHDSYKRAVLQWEQKALAGVNKAIGFVNTHIEHKYHGAKLKRAYNDRWRILERNSFNPETDVMRNLDGVLELTGNKPDLTRDMLHYFSARDEDANTL